MTLLLGSIGIRHANVLDAAKAHAVGELGHSDVDVIMEENALNNAIQRAVGAVGVLIVGKLNDGNADVVRRRDGRHACLID